MGLFAFNQQRERAEAARRARSSSTQAPASQPVAKAPTPQGTVTSKPATVAAPQAAPAAPSPASPAAPSTASAAPTAPPTEPTPEAPQGAPSGAGAAGDGSRPRRGSR